VSQLDEVLAEGQRSSVGLVVRIHGEGDPQVVRYRIQIPVAGLHQITGERAQRPSERRRQRLGRIGWVLGEPGQRPLGILGRRDQIAPERLGQ
jgi:hypothetical protein